MSYFKTCPTCRYYLHATVSDDKLYRVCKTCGYEEEDKGGRIIESFIKEGLSDSYKIIMNEFTRQDPTLPYLKDLNCPNGVCPSIKNPQQNENKIYYMKYDATNMKFVYICNNCESSWTSK